MDFVAYVDASWANCKMTGRLSTGYLVQWNDNLVSWRSKKRTSTSLSLTEAKYVVMSDLVKELLWLHMVVGSSLGMKIPEKLSIFKDNQAAIQLANNESNHLSFKTKHMNLCYHFVQAEIIAKQIVIQFKRTHLMLADFLTKTIGRSSIFKFLRVLNAAMPSRPSS